MSLNKNLFLLIIIIIIINNEYKGDSNANHYWSPWNYPGKVTGITGDQKRNMTFQTTALLRSARIIWRVLKSWWDLLPLHLHEHSQNLNQKERLIVAAQDQSFVISSLKKSIYQNMESNKCLLCDIKVEDVIHIISVSEILVQKKYKGCHVNICQKSQQEHAQRIYVPVQTRNSIGEMRILKNLRRLCSTYWSCYPSTWLNLC